MLSARQRGYLCGLAQSRDCLVVLGRLGATSELSGRLAELLAIHELVKLRFGDFKQSRREIAASLAEGANAELVRIVGNVAIFWKPNPEKPKIVIDA